MKEVSGKSEEQSAEKSYVIELTMDRTGIFDLEYVYIRDELSSVNISGGLGFYTFQPCVKSLIGKRNKAEERRDRHAYHYHNQQ